MHELFCPHFSTSQYILFFQKLLLGEVRSSKKANSIETIIRKRKLTKSNLEKVILKAMNRQLLN